jgi:hypothetical protein
MSARRRRAKINSSCACARNVSNRLIATTTLRPAKRSMLAAQFRPVLAGRSSRYSMHAFQNRGGTMRCPVNF